MTSSTASSPFSSAAATALTERAGLWTGVSLAPHPERAVAFHLDDRLFGVLHPDGLLEIPMPTPIRTVLVQEGFATPQAARPGAEWIATHLHRDDDVDPAALLLRLSYLYRRLLRSQNPATLRHIRIELTQYTLPSALDDIYEAMLAKRTAAPSARPSPPKSR